MSPDKGLRTFVLFNKDGNAVSEAMEQISSAMTDTGIFCLAMVLRFHKLPADVAQFNHQYAAAREPLDALSLVRAAR